MPTFLHTVEYKGTDGNMYTLNPVTVDNEVDASSENPVQNKVIKSYVDGLIGDINTALTTLNTGTGV